MSEDRFSFPACMIAAKGRIELHDVMLLRKFSFPEGLASRDHVVSLVALHRACPEQCLEWEVFFVEALADFIVHKEAPHGKLDGAKTGWMIETFASDGVVTTKLELDMIVHAAELAGESTELLSTFILDQIRRSLLPDPCCVHALLRPPVAAVTAYDMALVWQVLRSAVHRGKLVLSPKEQMLLSEIDMLTDADQNHPAWRDLMTQIAGDDAQADVLRSVARTMADSSSLSDDILV